VLREELLDLCVHLGLVFQRPGSGLEQLPELLARLAYRLDVVPEDLWHADGERCVLWRPRERVLQPLGVVVGDKQVQHRLVELLEQSVGLNPVARLAVEVRRADGHDNPVGEAILAAECVVLEF